MADDAFVLEIPEMVGIALPPQRKLLAQRGLHLHDYGKRPRPGRKVGHCTVVEPTAAARDRRARALLRELAVDVRIP